MADPKEEASDIDTFDSSFDSSKEDDNSSDLDYSLS